MIHNLAFYRFVPIADPQREAQRFEAACRRSGLRGTVLVAPEGVNAMVAGPADGADLFLDWLRADVRFADVSIKVSRSHEIPFRKLGVKVKPEIVTMRMADVDVCRATAARVAPEVLRDWLRRGEDVVLIDTRNDFEFAHGSFRGAINPGTASFGEFPGWVDAQDEALRHRKVVMFCTGGIRCEKATSWMLGRGFADLHQLDGGILAYFERIEDAERDWRGDLFVFDERELLDTRLRPA